MRRIAELPDAGEPADEHSDVQDRVLLLRRAVELLRVDVEERTWLVFWRAVAEEHAPADIAADLGMSTNAVYLIKARLLRRLRDEFGHLLS